MKGVKRMKNHIFLVLLAMIVVTIFSSCKKQEKNTVAPQISKAENNIATTQNTATINPQQKENALLSTPDEKELEEKHIITIPFSSQALSASLDGNSPEKELILYLPSDYYSSTKRYPVVYYFHGFGETPYYVREKEMLFEKFMKETQGKDFIIVGVDGRTDSANGSFYVNSTVTGLWEDYVIKEVIPFIDDNYRTISKAAARGITGFSMGGYACVNLGLLHPDVFSSILALCPGLLKNEELDLAMKSWENDYGFLTSYGRAFAPNVNSDSLCDIPLMNNSEEDLSVQEKWLDGFGNLESKIDIYLKKNMPLKDIEILYGVLDYYTWISNGSIYFSELLTDKGIDNTLVELKDGHEIPGDFIKNYMIPFFTENLEFDKEQ